MNRFLTSRALATARRERPSIDRSSTRRRARWGVALAAAVVAFAVVSPAGADPDPQRGQSLTIGASRRDDVTVVNQPTSPVPVAGSVSVTNEPTVNLAGPVAVTVDGPLPVTFGDVATRPSLQGAFTGTEELANLGAKGYPLDPIPAGQRIAISSLTLFNAQDAQARVNLEIAELSGDEATCGDSHHFRHYLGFALQPHENLHLTFPSPMILPDVPLTPQSHSWCLAVAIFGGESLNVNQVLVTGVYG